MFGGASLYVSREFFVALMEVILGYFVKSCSGIIADVYKAVVKIDDDISVGGEGIVADGKSADGEGNELLRSDLLQNRAHGVHVGKEGVELGKLRLWIHRHERQSGVVLSDPVATEHNQQRSLLQILKSGVHIRISGVRHGFNVTVDQTIQEREQSSRERCAGLGLKSAHLSDQR